MRRREPGTQIKQVESGRWQSPHTYYLTVGFALGLEEARLHHSKWTQANSCMCITWYSVSKGLRSLNKNSAHNMGDPASILKPGRPPGEGNGNPLQYSCLENSMDRGTWRAGHRQDRSQRVGHDWMTFQFQGSEIWGAFNKSIVYFAHPFSLWITGFISCCLSEKGWETPSDFPCA